MLVRDDYQLPPAPPPPKLSPPPKPPPKPPPPPQPLLDPQPRLPPDKLPNTLPHKTASSKPPPPNPPRRRLRPPGPPPPPRDAPEIKIRMNTTITMPQQTVVRLVRLWRPPVAGC